MKHLHYAVHGLFSTPMKTQLKNALNELNGVQNVNVDLQRGSVEVDYKEPATEKEIRSTIEHINCKIV